MKNTKIGTLGTVSGALIASLVAFGTAQGLIMGVLIWVAAFVLWRLVFALGALGVAWVVAERKA